VKLSEHFVIRSNGSENGFSIATTADFNQFAISINI
jgi:hypothetical protein